MAIKVYLLSPVSISASFPPRLHFLLSFRAPGSSGHCPLAMVMMSIPERCLRGRVPALLCSVGTGARGDLRCRSLWVSVFPSVQRGVHSYLWGVTAPGRLGQGCQGPAVRMAHQLWCQGAPH